MDNGPNSNDQEAPASGVRGALASTESILGNIVMARSEIVNLSPRALAHLGDAVFHLFEREREIHPSSSVKQMHNRARVSAARQSNLLGQITPFLSEMELEVVRRARNIKATGSRKAEQATYRRATAFEALLGYLYLTDTHRLRSVLRLTLSPADHPAAEPDNSAQDNP